LAQADNLTARANTPPFRQPKTTSSWFTCVRILMRRNINVMLEELLEYCVNRLHPSAPPDSISTEEQESGELD
jgi:hypothetical protein